jgi:hypothetical protein
MGARTAAVLDHPDGLVRRRAGDRQRGRVVNDVGLPVDRDDLPDNLVPDELPLVRDGLVARDRGPIGAAGRPGQRDLVVPVISMDSGFHTMMASSCGDSRYDRVTETNTCSPPPVAPYRSNEPVERSLSERSSFTLKRVIRAGSRSHTKT